MIGSAENATAIKEWHDGHYEDWGFDFRTPPAGWQYLGAGAFRRAYLGPDGVVYKVEKWENEEQTNEGEIREISRLLRENNMPEGSRLPKACYFTNSKVMAMERLDETLSKLSTECTYTEWERYMCIKEQIRMQCGILDLHNENVMVDTGTHELVPVDLAAESY